MALALEPEDLRTRRLRAGITQRALAQRANCSLSSIRLYEAGWRPRSASHTLARVQRVLDELAQQGTIAEARP